MIKVNNKKMISLLALKAFQANGGRNFVAIIAIGLTTILFTSLFTIGLGMKASIEQETMRQAGGSAHASLKYLSDQQFEAVRNHPLIKEIGIIQTVAMADNPEFLKRHVEISYYDEIGAKLGFIGPLTGDMPLEENEIIADTVTLDLLGVPHEVGRSVTLDYTIEDEKHTNTFVVVGYWEGNPAYSVGQVCVSQAFIENELAQVSQNYWEDHDAAKTIRADIMFRNSFNLEQKVQQVISESGYSFHDSEASPDNINYGVNWSYLTTDFSFDIVTVIGFLSALVLIIFTGYLIIYNIFQISVIQDIRFYGLLKTIGTTSKQIQKIVSRQAIFLSMFGIPFGLVLGYFLGICLIPAMIRVSSYSNAVNATSLDPIIFFGAASFSLVTVWISVQKPSQIASKVSPIEAVRYTGVAENFRQRKRSTFGRLLFQMALSNLGRNKKRTVVAVISLSLSIILLNTVYTFTNGFDMEKYLSHFVKTDFLIGNANYFNVLKGFRSPEDELSQQMIDFVSAQPGFEDGGKLYYNLGPSNISYFGDTSELLNPQENGFYRVQLFGLENFAINQLEIVEGQLDLEKLLSGKYILEGVYTDDHGNVLWNKSHYEIGDKIKIDINGNIHEYEILAKCVMDNSNHVRYWGDFGFYLSAKEFHGIVDHPKVMSYQFNVEDSHEAAMEKAIKNYTENIEPIMHYESKALFEDEFKEMQNLFIVVGGALSFIVGMIGILNFINAVITSIFSRSQEFAMLQGIGMTSRQLLKLVVNEGLIYSMCTISVSLIMSVLLSKLVLFPFGQNLWFFTYHFEFLPLLIADPILIVISIFVPILVLKGSNQMTIIERLREIQ